MNDFQMHENNDRRSVSPSDQMISFVQAAGGRVRFDAYAHEHILGETTGFYSHLIDLSTNHAPVMTPMHHDVGYREAYAMLLLHEARKLALRNDKSQILVAEIGPGGGELQKALCERFEREKESLFPLEKVDYIAVDPNQSHVDALALKGVPAVQGMAQKLPFENRSIDLIVAEEVLDTLPFRIFRWDNSTKKFTGEAFVEIKNGEMHLLFDEIERDPQTDVIEKWLAQSGYDQNYYSYSPESPKFWSELRRVLNPQGIAFVSDYSIESKVAGVSNSLGQVQMAVSRPYGQDLTHFIDFGLQEKIAKARGFGEISTSHNIEAFGLIGGLGTMLHVAIAGRLIIRATGTNTATVQQTEANSLDSNPITRRDVPAPKSLDLEELQALGDWTPGCKNVIRALSAEPEAAQVVEIFKRLGLRGGAFWSIYSDLADRDIRTFIQLVINEDPRAIEHARYNMDEDDHRLSGGGRHLPGSGFI